jgi:hypothetical protein
MRSRLVLSILTLCFCISVPAQAAKKIVWVSFSPGDNTPSSGAAGTGFTTAPDKAYTDLLIAAGFTVERYVQTATPDAALLNAADLVIVSRGVASTSFQDAAATRWNTTIRAPLMILSGYALRQSRLGFVTGETIPDTTGNITLTVNKPSHPIFAGIQLANGTMVNPYAGVVNHPVTNALMRGISICTDAPNANGTVLATVSSAGGGPAGGMVIGEWKAGVTVTHANGGGTDVLAGPRLIFLTGARETNGVSAETAGYYDLQSDGAKMFINAARYMVGDTGGGAAIGYPADKATDIPADAVLSWTAGRLAATHDVYLGTSQSDVDSASRTSPKGMLVSKDQAATTFDPAGQFGYGQTYYWRIDEVNGAPDFTVSKGVVWSFTAEGFGYPISGTIKATASSSLAPAMGPEKTVDGSGLDAKDQHSTLSTDAWLSKKGDSPVWIQYEFDKTYKLYQMWVWNSNQAVEPVVGFGAKDVKIETSLDGVTWTSLANVPEFAQATGEVDYVHNSTVSFGGVQAKFVKLTINTNWAEGTKQAGLSEVRFFYVPVKAYGPNPAAAVTDVALNGVLNWRPGREAAKHNVYLSTDANAVLNGTAPVNTVTGHSLPLAGLGLEYGRTYAWKVNEVNDAAATKVWEGDLWTFTTVAYAAVDDFESYDDKCNRIFFGWVDGFGYSSTPDCGVVGAAGNATGSTVGNINPPFAEVVTVHAGKQAMPMWFDNTKSPFYSETQHEWQTAQSWTGGGANTLTVWLRGDAPSFLEVSPGTLVMNGTGTDIWNTADQGRFVYKQLSGDGSIKAKVETLANTNAWAKAGVMIRQTLDAGSPFAYSVYGGTNGMRFQARLTAGIAAISDSSPTPPAEQTGARAPVWVKVERKGAQFNCYYATDAAGQNWTAMALGAQSISMPANVFIGLAVTSHAAGAVCGARFSGVATTGNVTGSWQSADLGTAQATTGNSPETFYVAVQDGSGKMKVVSNTDPTMICLGDWAAWNIPLSQFSSAGVNLNAVKKLTIGVGDRSSPKSGSAGKLSIDDIQLTRLAP